MSIDYVKASKIELLNIQNLERLLKHRVLLLRQLIYQLNHKEISQEYFNRVIKHLGKAFIGVNYYE